MPFLGVAGIGGLLAFLKAESKPTDVFGGVLSEDSTYFYRTFFGNGTLTVTGGILKADVMTIAGGGGSGGNFGGGGGAGGLLYSAAQSLTPTAYAVTVGAGSANDVFIQGSNSSFASLVAYGGGSGYGGVAGGGGPNSAQNGGSGGGGGGVNGASNANPWLGGTAVAGQGNVGSSGTYNRVGGAGGGAGAAGSGQAGGVGSSSYSAWGLATGTGHNVSGTVYYAGGGGGGGLSGYSGSGAGGNGGGGAGSNSGQSASGLANTGGGGGGGAGNYGGAPGGSGIVIVRYEKTAVQASTSAYELIGTISLAAAQASVTFSGIPGGYKHLQVRMLTRSDFGSTSDALNIQVNGDTTASYSRHWLEGNGSSVGSYVDTSATKAWLGRTVADGNTANVYTPWVVDILDYAQTSKNTTIRSFSGNVVGTINYVTFASGLWYKTPAVTSLTFLNNTGGYKAGSRFSLYGIRG
jgi:hypothetical protein